MIYLHKYFQIFYYFIPQSSKIAESGQGNTTWLSHLKTQMANSRKTLFPRRPYTPLVPVHQLGAGESNQEHVSLTLPAEKGPQFQKTKIAIVDCLHRYTQLSIQPSRTTIIPHHNRPAPQPSHVTTIPRHDPSHNHPAPGPIHPQHSLQ